MPPLTPGFDEVEEGVSDFAYVVLSFAFIVNEMFDNFPLRVRHIGAIARRAFHRFG